MCRICIMPAAYARSMARTGRLVRISGPLGTPFLFCAVSGRFSLHYNRSNPLEDWRTRSLIYSAPPVTPVLMTSTAHELKLDFNTEYMNDSLAPELKSSHLLRSVHTNHLGHIPTFHSIECRVSLGRTSVAKRQRFITDGSHEILRILDFCHPRTYIWLDRRAAAQRSCV